METYDIVPNGLDCPEVELREDGAPPGQCPLCNSEGAKKYFNAKSIRYTSTPDKAARDLQNKAAERGLENARARAAGKSVATSVGELADKLVESSLGKGVVVNEARKWEVMSSGGNRQEGKKPLR